MNIIITKNYQELSTCAAQLITDHIHKKPTLTLGLATGSTPIGMYHELVNLYQQQKIDFSHVTTFNLDEYLGLAPTHPQSYHTFMHEHLFNHININKKNIFIPDGLTHESEKFCTWYEQKIHEYNNIDVQILGIGRDGHIGFNEPGSSRDSCTRVVDLDQPTIIDNARFFDHNTQAVPTQAITMGIATILSARTCILLASGKNKADIVARALTGPISPDIPASFLQTHPQLIVILDQEASSIIPTSLHR